MVIFIFCLVFLLGLSIGSFLNVVIVRLPDEINLAIPRSRCPHCQTPIHAWDNIPILSFLLLRGRCRHCRTAISWRYPLVEFSTALLTTLTFWHFGLQVQTLFAFFFIWFLIALFFIDLDTQLLPDQLTLPLLWLGLLANVQHLFIDLSSAVVGAIAGYLSLWTIAQLYLLLTKRPGMGHGDFKLLAALGAWLGWQVLPLIIFLSSLLGLVCGALILFIHKQDRHTPIAFGPYLALAGGVALFFGNTSWLLLA